MNVGEVKDGKNEVMILLCFVFSKAYHWGINRRVTRKMNRHLFYSSHTRCKNHTQIIYIVLKNK